MGGVADCQGRQNGNMQPAPGRAMFAIRGETMSQPDDQRDTFGVISGRATFQTPIPRRMAMPQTAPVDCLCAQSMGPLQYGWKCLGMVFRWIQDQFPEASGQTAQPSRRRRNRRNCSRVDRIFVTVPTAPGIARLPGQESGPTLLRHIPACALCLMPDKDSHSKVI